LLFAAGATKLEPWAAQSFRRLGTVLAVMVASSLLVLPLALPVLPARTLQASRLGRIAYPADTTNWPSLVGVVSRSYAQLPSSLRSTTVILAGDYGDAAAITVVGANLDLPAVYCAQNNFWLWGRRPKEPRPCWPSASTLSRSSGSSPPYVLLESSPTPASGT